MLPSAAFLIALLHTALAGLQGGPPPGGRPPGAPQTSTPARPDPQPSGEPVPTYAETVVVTASRTEEKLLNAPASMTVVSEAQLSASPASAIAETLQGVAGMNVVQLNAREFNVTSRQASGVQTQGQLVLLDGRVVNNGNSGMHWDQLPIELDELKQIEVLHGPGSVVWGSNALSAVVNLRTKSPRELEGLMLSAGLGEVGLRTGSFRWAHAAEKISYKLSASYTHHRAWPRSPTLPDGSPATAPFNFRNADVHQPKADFRLDYDAGKQRVWSFRVGYGGSSGMLFTNDLPFEFDRSTYMSFADVSYSAPAFDARVYWTRSAGKLKSVIDGSSSPFSADFPTAEINAHRVLTPKHLLVYGASTRLDFFHLQPIPNRHSRHEVGGYVEDQMFLHPRVTLNAGVHLDRVQTSGSAISPRLSVLVKPAVQHALRFSVSRAYRPPTPVENFLGLATGYPVPLGPELTTFVPFSIVGNESLDEVRSLGIEAGYTGVLARRHTLQATVYHVAATGTIQIGTSEFYSPEAPPAGWPFPPATVPRFALPKTATYRNTGDITDRGVELSLNSAWPGDAWSVASYTYQGKPELTHPDPAFPVAVNVPPRHQVNVLVGWSHGPWRGSIGESFTGRAFWTDVVIADPRLHGYTKAFAVTNLSASYALPARHVEFVFKATNLFNRDVQQHVFGDIIGREASAYVRLNLKK